MTYGKNFSTLTASREVIEQIKDLKLKVQAFDPEDKHCSTDTILRMMIKDFSIVKTRPSSEP